MIELVGRVTVDDRMLYHGMDKDRLERYTTEGLSRSFANALIEHKDFQKSIVKRERNIDPFNFPETIYETRMVLLTPAEAKEFEELKEFQRQMKMFVK